MLDTFKYLGKILGKNGSIVDDMISRVNMGKKEAGAMSKV